MVTRPGYYYAGRISDYAAHKSTSYDMFQNVYQNYGIAVALYAVATGYD